MENKINIFIIGLGRWGKILLNLIADNEIGSLFKIGGIVTTRKNSNDIKKFSDKYGFKIFCSLDSALESRPDAIFISTPDFNHLDCLQKIYLFCKKKGCSYPHLLIEKPLGNDIKKCVEVLKNFGYKINRRGYMKPSNTSPIIFIDWHKKFSPQQKYSSQIISKNISKISSIKVSYLDQKKVFSRGYLSWFHKTDLFSFLLGHYLDLIFDSIENSVPIMVSVMVAFDKRKIMREAYVNLAVSLDGGSNTIPVNLIVSCNEPNNSYALTEQKVTYLFNDSRISIDTTGRDVEIIDREGIKFKNVHGDLLFKDKWDGKSHVSGYIYDLLKRWIKLIRDLRRKKISVKNVLHNYPLSLLPEIVINACKLSLDNGIKKGNLIMGRNIEINLKELKFKII